jgi:hypothetical protein
VQPVSDNLLGRLLAISAKPPVFEYGKTTELTKAIFMI